MTSSLSLRCPVLGRLSPALLLAWTLCVCLSVAQAAESPPTKKEKTKEQLEVLSQMAMWPQISIRDLLAGEESAPPPSSSGDTSSPPVDLLFVLQAQNLTFLPNTEGGIIGATVKLKGVYETIVSFADRPYRTFDSIPVSEFFAYPLVQDFFRGPNPPNAIVAGELPVDIAQHFARRNGTSDILPHRRLLGGVLGAASYDAGANELEFRLPAGIDIFQADGSTRIVTSEVFEEIEEAYANAGPGAAPTPDAANGDTDALPVLQQVSLFIDSFGKTPPPVASGGGRKLLQRRGAVGRRGGRGVGFGRAGAVRVGGGGAVRPSAGRRGFSGGVTNNFIRGGGGNVLVGGAGWRGRGLGWGGGIYGNALGWGGAGVYGDPYYDPLFGSRALAYSQPYPQAVPVPVPVPVPTQTQTAASVEPSPPAAPALSVADVVAALSGVWRGDGGGKGMGQIVITTNEDGQTASVSASPTGCADCASGCRWSTARGTVRIVGDTATVDATIDTCDGGTETTRATLERVSSGRNVLYWTPANVSTKWVRNA